MPLSDLSIVRVASPVRQQVEGALRKSILQGDLLPGQRLAKRTVAEQLGVSRPLLREALRQLESEGLITREGSRGPRVAVVTSGDVRQLYAVRMALEVVAVREFVARAGALHRKKIAEAVDRMQAAVTGAQASEASKWKNEFYAVLVQETRCLSSSSNSCTIEFNCCAGYRCRSQVDCPSRQKKSGRSTMPFSAVIRMPRNSLAVSILKLQPRSLSRPSTIAMQ